MDYRRVVALILAIGCLVPFFLGIGDIIVSSVLVKDYFNGDNALIELYTRQAVEGKHLVGMYSRMGWNHPGPLYFYAVAPVYYFFGATNHAVMYAVATLGILATCGIMYFLWRLGGDAAFPTLAVLLLLYFRSLTLGVIVNPWTPHVVVLPFTLLLLVISSMRPLHPRLFPLIALLATFLVQTHMVYFPVVTFVFVLSAVYITLNWKEYQCVCSRKEIWIWSSVTVAVGVLLWLPPVIEELGPGQGNLSQLLDYLLSGRGNHSLYDALTVVARHVAAMPLFVFDQNSPYTPKISPLLAIPLLLVVLAIGTATFVFSRKHRQYRIAFMSLLGVAGILFAVYAGMKTDGDLHEYLIKWTRVFPFLICSAAAIFGFRRMAGKDEKGALRSILTIALPAFLAVLLLLSFHNDVNYIFRIDDQMRFVKSRYETFENLGRLVAERHIKAIRVEIERHDSWPEAAGAVLFLQKLGVNVSVAEPFTYMYGAGFRDAGQPDARLLFVSKREQRQLLRRKDHYVYVGVIGRDALILDETKE